MVYHFIKRLLSINSVTILNCVQWSTNVQMQQVRILCLLPINILFHGKSFATTPPNREKVYQCFWQVVDKLYNSHGDMVHHFNKRLLSINSITILNWVQWSTNVQIQQVRILYLLPIYILFHGKSLAKTPPNVRRYTNVSGKLQRDDKILMVTQSTISLKDSYLLIQSQF